MLHTELGEGSLAAVCRLYPRGVRTEGVRECSCANSCEAVLELLLQKSEPLRFSYQELALEPSADEKEFLPDDDALKRESIRLWCIARIQDRRYSLPRRILWLGISLLLLEDAYKAQDIQRMQVLMGNEEPILLPEPICPGEGPLTLGLEMANHMLQILDEKSSSIREYGESELAYFGTGEEECKKYMQACAQFADLLPQWEVWFEHMLVNHMFFTQFPFQSQPVAMEEEFLGICSIYALVRFLAVGWAAQHHSVEDIVDVVAMAFRLIDHTDFDKIASHIIKKLGYDDRRHIWQMLHL